MSSKTHKVEERISTKEQSTKSCYTDRKPAVTKAGRLQKVPWGCEEGLSASVWMCELLQEPGEIDQNRAGMTANEGLQWTMNSIFHGL